MAVTIERMTEATDELRELINSMPSSVPNTSRTSGMR